MQRLFLAINLINMHFCRVTWGRAVIGCGYGAPQPIIVLSHKWPYTLCHKYHNDNGERCFNQNIKILVKKIQKMMSFDEYEKVLHCNEYLIILFKVAEKKIERNDMKQFKCILIPVTIILIVYFLKGQTP